MYESIQLNDEDSKDIHKVIETLDSYCIGEINITYEQRYVLNKRSQEETESFDVYIRTFIKSCE